MKTTIHLFLASSITDLEKDRESIGNFINELNNIYNKQKLFRHGKANNYYKNDHNNYDDNISATIILNDALTLLQR